MSDNQEREILEAGIRHLGFSPASETSNRLLEYLSLLEKWNQAINLTAIRERDRMVTHHLLDSLSVLPYLPASLHHLADIGSGAGLPGIPLAIVRPDISVSLVEPNQKKVAFLRQAKGALGLINLEVIGKRVEDIPPSSFDCVVSRAFADLPDFVRVSERILLQGGSLIAMKGVVPYEEIGRLPDYAQTTVQAIDLPDLAASRHLIIVRFEPIQEPTLPS
jgi:16S rRNA (guanine527-N7)-methyltransferase